MEQGQAIAVGFEIDKSRTDAAKRQVWGFATIETPDPQRDIVGYEGSKTALTKLWRGNVREQHDPLRTIGKGIHVEAQDERKGVYIGVQLSKTDDGERAWQKVQEGILTGFSVKGKVTKAHKVDVDGVPHQFVDSWLPEEVSLVDVNCTPGAEIALIKSLDGAPVATDVVQESESATENAPEGATGTEIEKATDSTTESAQASTAAGEASNHAETVRLAMAAAADALQKRMYPGGVPTDAPTVIGAEEAVRQAVSAVAPAGMTNSQPAEAQQTAGNFEKFLNGALAQRPDLIQKEQPVKAGGPPPNGDNGVFALHEADGNITTMTKEDVLACIKEPHAWHNYPKGFKVQLYDNAERLGISDLMPKRDEDGQAPQTPAAANAQKAAVSDPNDPDVIVKAILAQVGAKVTVQPTTLGEVLQKAAERHGETGGPRLALALSTLDEVLQAMGEDAAHAELRKALEVTSDFLDRELVAHYEPADDLTKSGARHSTGDRAAIQSLHDTACTLGAGCKDGEMAKVSGGLNDVEAQEIVKATVVSMTALIDRRIGDLEKAQGASLTKVASVVLDHEARLKHVEAQPANDPNAPMVSALGMVEKTLGGEPDVTTRDARRQTLLKQAQDAPDAYRRQNYQAQAALEDIKDIFAGR